jgi:hypothetical protein
VAEHGLDDEREEVSFFIGPQDGSSGVDERGDKGIGSSVEDGGEQEAATSTTDAPKIWGASPAARTIWTKSSLAAAGKKQVFLSKFLHGKIPPRFLHRAEH